MNAIRRSPRHPSRRLVSRRKIGESKLPAHGRRFAPQLHPYPGKQLLERERLNDVVVRAVFEPGNPVGDGIPRRQNQDREVGIGGSQPAADFEAVQFGHQHVQDHQVRPGLAGEL